MNISRLFLTHTQIGQDTDEAVSEYYRSVFNRIIDDPEHVIIGFVHNLDKIEPHRRITSYTHIFPSSFRQVLLRYNVAKVILSEIKNMFPEDRDCVSVINYLECLIEKLKPVVERGELSFITVIDAIRIKRNASKAHKYFINQIRIICAMAEDYPDFGQLELALKKGEDKRVRYTFKYKENTKKEVTIMDKKYLFSVRCKCIDGESSETVSFLTSAMMQDFIETAEENKCIVTSIYAGDYEMWNVDNDIFTNSLFGKTAVEAITSIEKYFSKDHEFDVMVKKRVMIQDGVKAHFHVDGEFTVTCENGVAYVNVSDLGGLRSLKHKDYEPFNIVVTSLKFEDVTIYLGSECIISVIKTINDDGADFEGKMVTYSSIIDEYIKVYGQGNSLLEVQSRIASELCRLFSNFITYDSDGKGVLNIDISVPTYNSK